MAEFTHTTIQTYIRSPCHRKHDAMYGYTDVNGQELLIYLGNKKHTPVTRAYVFTCCSEHLNEDGCDECMQFLTALPLTNVGETFPDAKPYKVGMQTAVRAACKPVLQYGEIRLENGKVAFVLLRDVDAVNLVGTAAFGVCYRAFSGRCDECCRLLYMGQKTWRV